MSIDALGNCDNGNSALLPPDCTQVLSKYMSKDERRNCLELPEGSNALFEAKELCPQGCPDSTTQKIVREFAAKVKRAFSEKEAADVEAVQKKRLKESLHHLHSEVLLKQKNPEKKELTKLISAIQFKMLDEKTHQQRIEHQTPSLQKKYLTFYKYAIRNFSKKHKLSVVKFRKN